MRWNQPLGSSRVKGSGAITFARTHPDITLTKRVVYEYERRGPYPTAYRTFPEYSRRAVIGRKRTGRHYGDRVTPFRLRSVEVRLLTRHPKSKPAPG